MKLLNALTFLILLSSSLHAMEGSNTGGPKFGSAGGDNGGGPPEIRKGEGGEGATGGASGGGAPRVVDADVLPFPGPKPTPKPQGSSGGGPRRA